MTTIEAVGSHELHEQDGRHTIRSTIYQAPCVRLGASSEAAGRVLLRKLDHHSCGLCTLRDEELS